MTFLDSMTVAYCCLSYPTYPFLAFSEIVSEICMRCSAADAASDRPRRWSTMARASTSVSQRRFCASKNSFSHFTFKDVE